MGEILQAPQGFGHPEAFCKNDLPSQLRDKAALPGQTEFFRKKAPVTGYGNQRQGSIAASDHFSDRTFGIFVSLSLLST